MRYTVKKNGIKFRYKGIAPFCEPGLLSKDTYFVVLAWWEDYPELWVIENDEALETLRRMYREIHGDTKIEFTKLVEIP